MTIFFKRQHQLPMVNTVIIWCLGMQLSALIFKLFGSALNGKRSGERGLH